MHILETYALLAGCTSTKSFIHEEEINLPSKPYITFHPHSPKGNHKQYDWWNNVLEMLNDNENFNYEIIQVGATKEDEHYVHNIDYLGSTNFWQLAYLIKHSSLHLGFDSLPVHLASHYDIPIVAIYSYYKSTCRPYFSTEEKVRLLEPDFSYIKPTYGDDDPNRLINNINPNNIYNSVVELLNL